MTIHLLPIEPLEERYSAQWYRWWPAVLREQGHEVNIVDGKRLADSTIEHGEFLDALDTNYYKATQLSALVQQWHRQLPNDGDTVLFLDAWNPCVEQIAYMRDTLGLKVRIAGLLHAGTYDPFDFLAQKGLGYWGRHAERAWVHIYDDLFFATEFHRVMFALARCGEGRARLHVEGFPLYAKEWQAHAKPWSERERLVVFPHRLASEKQPDVWEKIKDVYREAYPSDAVTWVRTKDVCTQKAEYYEVLGLARVAVSAALQETWGIAMLEAASLGCHLVAPKALSYAELYPSETYQSLNEAVELIKRGLDSPDARPWDGSRWERAIPDIAKVLT